ncbi:hypothetical protein DdX_13764 [Ditylenchus destructor]|uniref:Saposin B-type domain-containing protein n=1 Tax=Ditylenchus destructor TaxID=166010 RepID=A0AAD4MUK8_9BILA|nr:hypothetical protein DdX_13764 [Ditylenchus destructor]
MAIARIVVLMVSAFLLYKACDAQDKCLGEGACDWGCRECTVAMQRMANLINPKGNETAFIESFKRLMTWEVKCYSLSSFFDGINHFPTCCERPAGNGSQGDGRADCATKIWNHALTNGVIDPLKACLILEKCTTKEVQCEKE